MLRISRLTDYGVVLSTHLATVHSGPARSVRELALETGLPRPTVAKVLKQLSAAGIARSVRGIRGGYRLARAPEEVSLSDVIMAVEGPIAMTDCDGAPGTCEYEGRCGAQASWQRVSAAVRAALAQIPLTEMAAPLTLVSLRKAPSPRPTS
jgi:FeS assembly SUF system regulator